MIQINDATCIRPMVEGDLPFVVDSWLKTFQFSKNRRQCDRQAFFRCHYPIVRFLLEKSPRRVVACDPAIEDNIQAWAVGDIRSDRVPVVHYCYVREAFADVGLETLLFGAVTGNAPKVIVSHLCPALDGKTPDGVEVFFDPYSIVLREPPAPQEPPQKAILTP